MEFEVEELFVALQSDDVQMLAQFLNTGLQLDMKIADPKHVLPPFLQKEPPLLSMAAYYCARNCFKLIAERYQNFFMKDNAGNPITEFAILGGDCDIIDLLKGFGLEFEKSLPFAAKNRCGTAFRFICMIQDKPFDINIMDADKNSAVHYAAANGDLDLLKFLSEYETNFALKNGDSDTPLILAAKNGRADCVRYLSDMQTLNVNEADKENTTPLLWAVKKSFAQCARFLLRRKDINVNAKDNNGVAPIHCAALYGHKSIVEAISKTEGADIGAKTNSGQIVLHCAAQGGNEETMRYILGKQSSFNLTVDETDDSLMTPLHIAAAHGNVGSARLLKKAKANFQLKDKEGNTPLHTAAKHGSTEILRLFEEEDNAPFGEKNNRKMTPLHLAADEGRTETCRYLLSIKEKVDPNAMAEFDKTPLHYAAQKGFADVVRVFCDEEKCNINQRNVWGKTPLHYATLLENTDAVLVLVSDPRIDVNILNNFGNAPLHYTARTGSYDEALMILDKENVRYNEIGARGMTPLLSAVHHNHERIVDLLLEKPDLDVKLKDRIGRSALDYSTIIGNPIVRSSLYKYINEPEPVLCSGSFVIPPPPPPPPSTI